MNRVKLSSEELKQQLDGRKKFQYFVGPMLDAYGFCFWLYESLVLDGFDNADPNEIMHLLMELAQTYTSNKEHIVETHVNSMTSEMYRCYPEGKAILIHIAPIVGFIHEFIFMIGSSCLNINHDEESAMFSYWLEAKHKFTFTLLHTMFTQLRGLMKEVSGLKDSLINLHISLNFKSRESYLENVREKNDLHSYAREQLNKAILDCYFLEAIALTESIVSDLLSMVLFVKGKNSKSKSFFQLATECKDLISSDLNSEIDSWRKKRNSAIHNLVRTSPLERQISPKNFQENSKAIANEGVQLIKKVDFWFDDFINDEMSPFNIRV